MNDPDANTAANTLSTHDHHCKIALQHVRGKVPVRAVTATITRFREGVKRL